MTVPLASAPFWGLTPDFQKPLSVPERLCRQSYEAAILLVPEFQNVYNNVRASRSSCLPPDRNERQMFEGSLFLFWFAPPISHVLYNFLDGAQVDIFEDSDISSGTELKPFCFRMYCISQVKSTNPALVSSARTAGLTIPLARGGAGSLIHSSPLFFLCHQLLRQSPATRNPYKPTSPYFMSIVSPTGTAIFAPGVPPAYHSSPSPSLPMHPAQHRTAEQSRFSCSPPMPDSRMNLVLVVRATPDPALAHAEPKCRISSLIRAHAKCCVYSNSFFASPRLRMAPLNKTDLGLLASAISWPPVWVFV
jgi:hypothetical protein